MGVFARHYIIGDRACETSDARAMLPESHPRRGLLLRLVRPGLIRLPMPQPPKWCRRAGHSGL